MTQVGDQPTQFHPTVRFWKTRQEQWTPVLYLRTVNGPGQSNQEGADVISVGVPLTIQKGKPLKHTLSIPWNGSLGSQLDEMEVQLLNSFHSALDTYK